MSKKFQLFAKNEKQPARELLPTIIPAGSSLTGDMWFTTDVHILGEIVGEIRTDKKLSIGPGGKVLGDIYADQLHLEGLATGNKFTARQILLCSGSRINGTVIANVLTVQNGAVIDGNVFVNGQSHSDDLETFIPLTSTHTFKPTDEPDEDDLDKEAIYGELPTELTGDETEEININEPATITNSRISKVTSTVPSEELEFLIRELQNPYKGRTLELPKRSLKPTHKPKISDNWIGEPIKIY